MTERHQAPWAEGVLFERLAVGDYAAIRIRTKPEHGVAREEHDRSLFAAQDESSGRPSTFDMPGVEHAPETATRLLTGLLTNATRSDGRDSTRRVSAGVVSLRRSIAEHGTIRPG